MVYAQPSAGPDERAAMWKECERRYLPHRNYGGLQYLESGRFWQRQRHIYQYPFYYIDYCLAQTVPCSFGIELGAIVRRPWKSTRSFVVREARCRLRVC